MLIYIADECREHNTLSIELILYTFFIVCINRSTNEPNY